MSGSVANIAPFGVFLDVGAERNALLCVPSHYWRKFAVGDRVDHCVVLQVERDLRRFCLTVPDVEAVIAANRVPLEDLREGDLVDGVIDHVNAYGAWVNIGAIVMGRLNVPRKCWTELQRGQRVPNIIIDRLDLETQKLGLTMRNPEALLDAVAAQRSAKGQGRRIDWRERRKASPPTGRPRSIQQSVPQRALPRRCEPPARQGHWSPPKPVEDREVRGPPPWESRPLRSALKPLGRREEPETYKEPNVRVGSYVDGIVLGVSARGVLVTFNQDQQGLLVVPNSLRAEFQKGDEVQGMRVEQVDRRGVMLSLEEPELALDELPAPPPPLPRRALHTWDGGGRSGWSYR